MNIVRRGLLIIIAPLFSLLLFATAFDWGVVKTVGQPSSVKQIVSESGIYESLIPSLLTKVGSVNTSVGNLSATNPTVSAAANQAFSAKYIQTNAETAIDSVYAWLEGKTAQPTFSLNLSSAKTNFADSLATQFQQKAAALPICSTPYTASSFDISNATCLPPGVSAVSVGQSIKNDVSGGKDFIKDTTFSANNFKSDNSNQSIFQDKLKNLPTQYQRAKKTPVILALLSLVAAVAIFFLSPNRLKGLRRVGMTLLAVGLFMLLFSWGLNKAVTTKAVPNIKIKDNAVLTAKIQTLVTDITQRIDKNYWVFGGVYSVLGVAAIGTPMLMRRRAPGTAHESQPPPEQTAAETQEPKDSAPPPKPKRPIKIQ